MILMQDAEKKITIGIDVKGKNFNHKAKHAMTCLRNELQKHFRTTDFVISTEINKFIWSEGRANAPTKVPIIGVTKNNKAYLFLDGSEADKKNMDIVLGKVKEVSKEKKEEKKDEKKEHKEPEIKKEEKPKEQKEKKVEKKIINSDTEIMQPKKEKK